MAKMNDFFKKAMEYKAGDVKDSVQYEYVEKNGIYKVELSRLLSVANDTSVQAHIDFPIVGTDQLLSCKELLQYTDKSTGQPVESKGSNIIRAMIGMASGKANAKAQWASEKGRVFGKEVEGYTLPTLLKKEFYVAMQVERSIYKNKAQEANVIRRVLSVDGFSLSEYEDALNQLKDGTIAKLSEYKGTALEKEQGKIRKYKYKDCTEDEWNEANGRETEEVSGSDAGDDELPTINTEDELPPVVVEDELPTVVEETTTTPEVNTDGSDTDALPTINTEPSLDDVAL